MKKHFYSSVLYLKVFINTLAISPIYKNPNCILNNIPLKWENNRLWKKKNLQITFRPDVDGKKKKVNLKPWKPLWNFTRGTCRISVSILDTQPLQAKKKENTSVSNFRDMGDWSKTIPPKARANKQTQVVQLGCQITHKTLLWNYPIKILSYFNMLAIILTKMYQTKQNKKTVWPKLKSKFIKFYKGNKVYIFWNKKANSIL